MQTVPFIKMHGAGNDFVVVECRAEDYRLTKADIIEICDRHKGIGCDQLVLLKASQEADVRVEFYNGDGSQSGACGNATRCVASLIMMQTEQPIATIETASGILECYNTGEVLDSGEELYTVNMGAAKFGWQDIPLVKEMDTILLPLLLGEGRGEVNSSQTKNTELKGRVSLTPALSQGERDLSAPSAVSMGNPHAVFFVDDTAGVDLAKHGPILEHNEIFPKRANIGVAQIISKNEIKLRVWERGSGETLACGSGACAAVAAGVRRGLLANNVLVHLPGGDLNIEIIESGEIMMTGPVAVVFTGEIEL